MTTKTTYCPGAIRGDDQRLCRAPHFPTCRLGWLLLAVLLAASGRTACARQAWIDVTNSYVENASFENNTDAGWTSTGYYSTHTTNYGCTEFWNGTFTMSQQLTGLPDGHYRLSVQGFYRTRANDQAYQSHRNGTEKITASLFAGTAEQTLHSVYDHTFGTNLANNCWSYFDWGTWQTYYFPNGMASAHAAFEQDCYWNMMEFDVAGGSVTIGVRNTQSINSNWCIFDHFRLEYYGEVAEASRENVIFNEVMAANVDMFWSPASNFDGWAELYNPSDRDVYLGGLYLSDDPGQPRKWRLPDQVGTLPAGGYKLLWFGQWDEAPVTMAPFKLDVDGGVLCLSDEGGTLIASQTYPAALGRVSYARQADGTGTWGLTAQPTPGSSNAASAFATVQLPMPEVSEGSRLFSGTLQVDVHIPEGCTLRYTTDGTVPTADNGQTSTDGHFVVSATTNYRFRLLADGCLPSGVATRSYLLSQQAYTVPVVSIVAPSDFLYGDQHGVMTRGSGGKPGHGQASPCNWNMDWERPVSFCYMSADGEPLFQQDVSLKMCGGWSRAWTPHSFKLKGNKALGTRKTLDFPFFSQKPYLRNRTLQMRNGGNDNTCRFKDPALETILLRSGINIDAQSYQPVVHFLNGQYIGVINMREPNNKHYVFANYGWDDEEIDLFEMDPDSGYVQKCGTEESLDRWYTLSSRIAEAGVYEEVCQMVDMDEYVNYMAALLYLGTTDWPQNNLKGFFRRDGGRWRFVSFDLDFAFNTSDALNVFFNKRNYTFDWLYDKQTQLRAEIRMVTIFQNMLRHEDFRRRFIDAFCLMGGSVFEAARAKAIIDELANAVYPMMRLEGGSPWPTANDMKNKLTNWMPTMTNTLRNYSSLNLRNTTAQSVRLNADTQGARLFVNGQEVPYADFNGRLFAPVVLRAEAPAGYEFAGWKNPSSGQLHALEAETPLPAGTVTLTATFVPSATRTVHPVSVNEVSAANDSYVNDYFKRADWLELYNTTDGDIDVAGFYLSNDGTDLHRYRIEAGEGVQTVVPAHGHLVVWCDGRTPLSQMHAPFKLDDGGGTVYLTAADDTWTDVLVYPGHDANHTVARFPDGCETAYLTNVPTIGARNLRTSYQVPVPQDPVGISTVETAGADLRLAYVVDRLVAESAVATTGTVDFYTLAGQLVARTGANLRAGRTELPMAGLQPGCYVVRLTTADGRKTTCKVSIE